LANRLYREIPGSFRPDQCFNPSNSEAHYRSTARELTEQIRRNLAAVVCTVSTGACGLLVIISALFTLLIPGMREFSNPPNKPLLTT